VSNSSVGAVNTIPRNWEKPLIGENSPIVAISMSLSCTDASFFCDYIIIHSSMETRHCPLVHTANMSLPRCILEKFFLWRRQCRSPALFVDKGSTGETR
jgi:hypothetical protein